MRAESVVAWNNRGTECLRHGRHNEALRLLAKAASAAGPLSACHSNYLLSLLYHPGLTPEDVAGAHRSVAGPLTGRVKPRPHRRLRIAYLTPDFHFHPKAFLHIPHLPHYDRERFELYLYSSTPSPDAYTREARRAADHWRNVAGRPPDRVAKLIRSDAIDILIDITGHFAGSPLPVFALRPAPLQVSIPGYPATTGLATVDFKLVDRFTDPPGMTESQYSEELLRLPRSVLCYRPPDAAPPPGPAPCLRNGFVTFGSFNNRPKLNPPLIELWARILLQTPRSRLLLHHVFDGYREVSRSYRDPMARAFRAAGVSSRRLEFVGGVELAEHLAVIAEADLALDSFPYHGNTTTCECLWMGVPVVTLAGRAHWSRAGVSLLTSVGRADWVASSAADYVRLAVAKSRDPESLARIRANLRDTMGRSEITDSRGWIRSLEDCLSWAWRRAG